MRMKDIKKAWLDDNRMFVAEHINDKPMINECYLAYIDGLCKDGYITEKQYNNASLIYYFDYRNSKWYKAR